MFGIRRKTKRFFIKNFYKKSIIIAGMGRCGTTLLYKSISNKGFRTEIQFLDKLDDMYNYQNGYVYKTHSLPPEHLPENVKVIYMIGNVMDMVISAHKKINFWGKEHHQHLNSSGFIENDSIFDADTLGLDRHFDEWYNEKGFSFMTIHYDVLFEKNTILAIEKFLGVKITLPPFRSRESDWSDSNNKVKLMDTYGELHQKVESAQKLKIWS
jgi:hypothetical protein